MSNLGARTIQDHGWSTLSRFGAVAGLAAIVFIGGFGMVYGAPEFLSQFIDSDNHSEIIKEINKAKAATELPPGASWDPIDFANDDDELPDGVGHVYQRGVWWNAVQIQAECKWYQYWLEGFQQQDQAQMMDALNGIENMHDWWLFTEGLYNGQQILSDRIEQLKQGNPSTVKQQIYVMCSDRSPVQH